jgi:S1-C subfamily serine protease
MVLTSNGEILTNRHVVQGETQISVTVPATGRTYAAKVVGISTTTDVAVVQLENASGLDTVKTASDAVEVGDAVVGVGNAGGTGGRATAASGTVTATDQSIVASDEGGGNPERLTGLIETDAPIQPGDSGGPLLDDSNAVVGMDTAGSARGNDGYAIPIATALGVAQQIENHGTGTQAGAGTSSQSQTQSQRAVIGVQVQDGADGVEVGGVVEGSPAQAAGLEAGDVITAVGGHRVTSIEDLSSLMASVTPGQRLTVSWVDTDGGSHSARITTVAAS